MSKIGSTSTAICQTTSYTYGGREGHFFVLCFGHRFRIRLLDSRVPPIAFGFAFWIRAFLLSHSDSLVG